MRLAFKTAIAIAGLLGASITAQAAEPTYQGQFVQGGIVFGQTNAGDVVLLDGDAIDTIAPDGRFIIGFPRDYEGPAKLTVRHADGSTEEFVATCRIDTENEVLYYQNGGILQFVLRNMMKAA